MIIAEYSETVAGLAILKEKYKDVTYEVDKTEGMVLARKARAELRTLRTDLEKKRKEIKAPALERCKLIDSEAKRITSELVMLEDPIDIQIRMEDDRRARIKKEKEEAEQKRVDNIKEQIKVNIIDIPGRMMNSSSVEIKDFIDLLSGNALEEAIFEEFIGEAEMARHNTITTLTKMFDDACIKEEENARLIREREELEKEKIIQREKEAVAERKLKAEREKIEAEQAEKERIAAEKYKAEQEELDRKRADLEREQKERDEKIRLEHEKILLKEKEQAEKEKMLYNKEVALEKHITDGEYEITDVNIALTVLSRISEGTIKDELVKVVLRRKA